MFDNLFTMTNLLALASIVGINVILSGDNALVIALACRELPPVQRRIGIILGSLGAIVARLVLVFFAAFILDFPFVKMVGGLFLFYIAYKLVTEPADDLDHSSVDGLWAAVSTIVVADVVMSIDNVVAIAAAAKGNSGLLVAGLAISIPMIILGAEALSWLLEKYKWIIYAGALLLFYIAGETMLSDPVLSWVKI